MTSFPMKKSLSCQEFQNMIYMLYIIRRNQMIGISVATKWEWEKTLEYYKKSTAECTPYIYGDYFIETIDGKKVIFYSTGVRKVNGIGANQYMITKFDLKKVIVIGTSAGIDPQYKNLDIIVPNQAVQYDCTVKEIEPLLKQSFIVDIDLSKYNFSGKTGIIGTADKAVVMWKDYLELKENHITIADTEAGAIAYICKKNNVECIIIKGISDFPTDERLSDKIKSNEEQINVYLENTPKVMQEILDHYLNVFL